MKFKEFFTELVWDMDEKDWEISKTVDESINEWLESVDIDIIDIKYNVNIVGTKNECTQSTVLVIYKEKDNIYDIDNKYFEITTQNNKLVKCKDIAITSHSSAEYFRPYWIISVDKNEFILGCYETKEQAVKVLNEIFESDGKYKMPMWSDIK